MCGIGGILRVWPADQRDIALRTPHDQSIPEAWLDILDDSIKHRGPDGQGRFRDRAVRADGCVVDVAFVHRRLSIIDHAGGHQPMVLSLPWDQGARSAPSGSPRPIPGRILSVEDVTAHNRRVLAEAHAAPGASAADPELALGALQSTDRITVVFNGCIYNHRELRSDLQRAGHVFSTDHSDTEVLVHGWREWGGKMFDRLDGMFALVLWDASRAELVMARDRAGEKPLFESLPPGGSVLAFASSVPAVIRAMSASGFPQASTMPRDGRWILDDVWMRYGFAERPPTTHIQEVEPGDWRCVGQKKGTTSVFIHHTEPLPDRDASRSLTVESADHLLSMSVTSRLEADVELGCFLSGGVDSSLVSHYARQSLGKLNTYCVRMPDQRYDESPWASMVAAKLGTQHHTLDCEASPTEDLVTLVRQMGVPFGDSSLLPTYWVSRATRRATKVAIGGDGGDELFGGYERYKAARLLNRWHRVLRCLPVPPQGSDPKSKRAKFARLVQAAQGRGYGDLLAIFDGVDHAQLMDRPIERSPFVAEQDPLLSDFWQYLSQDLLRKSDTASMAVALEMRSPLLSRRLIDACFSTPLNVLMPHGQRKGLLRQVARKYLPAEIVDRPKMGFAIPIGEWFRTDYGGLRTMLLDHLNSTEPFGPPSLGIDLNMAFIRQMLDEHLGTGPSGMVKRDHSQRLYMLLVLSIWAKWVGGLQGGR